MISRLANRRLILFALKYIVGLGIIYLLVSSGNINLATISDLPPDLVMGCLGLMVVQTVVAAVRVQRLLASQGIVFTIARCAVFNCTGLFYSLFLPGGISGDAVRAYYFMQSSEERRMPILGALFLDRLIGLIAMVGMGVVAALVLALSVPMIRPYILAFIGIFFALTAMLVVFRLLGHLHVPDQLGVRWYGKLWVRLTKLVASLHLTRYPARVMVHAVLLSFVVQITAALIIYLCAVYVHAGLSLLEVSAVAPVGLLVNAIPISPGGLGVGEKGFEILFRGLQGSHGATAFLTSRLFLYSPALIGAIYGLQRLFLNRQRRSRAVIAVGQ
jgi:uncharacterized protein (TIRG00374 family)